MSDAADTPFGALLADLGERARERAAALAMAALEHVLRQQSWARERLRAHAGCTIRVAIEAPVAGLLPPADLRATVDAQGFLRAAALDAQPGVTLHVRPSVDALFEALREGPESVARHVRVEGDAALAATVGELARHLRWDVEEDLSRVAGDVAARRVGRLVEAGAGQLRDAGGRAHGAARRYLADDQRMLATRPLAGELKAAVRALHERVSALESLAASSRAAR
ncbi:MAG TPA: hypothetical protein VIT02_14550 [Burkholderiaceae bacterium]